MAKSSFSSRNNCNKNCGKLSCVCAFAVRRPRLVSGEEMIKSLRRRRRRLETPAEIG